MARQPKPSASRAARPPGMPNFEMPNLDSVNHCTGCTSKEMPNLDAVNHCTSKTESRFGISKFGIPIAIQSTIVQPIPADMRHRISIGKPNFVLPNLDSVNHCTSKYLFISILISLLVQWLTESRSRFGIGDLKNKQSTERESQQRVSCTRE